MNLSGTGLSGFVRNILPNQAGALLQVQNGPSAMISSFIILSISNFIYYKYRSIVPLFIAGVLFQTIDLITYWVYVI